MARGKKKEALTPEERLRAALVPDWEQPYKVPDNWCWTRLGASINLYNGDRGSNYPSKKDYQSRGIPFINAGAIVDGELNEAEFNYISEEKYNALRAGKIQQGDLLYCLRGSIGKTAIVHQEFKGAISSSLCILRTKESMLKEFLYYLLCSNVIWHQQALAENGSAQPNLSAASVMEYIIPLSPLPEQQRIADRIESLFAKLDEAKQKAQDALDSFETRKAAILHKAFTGEFTARWRKEHNVGMESWDYPRFEDCILKMQNGLAKRSGSSGTSFVVLRLANLSDNGFVTDDLREILLDEKEQKNYCLKDNDVLMIRVNGSKDNVGKQFLFYGKLKWAFCDHIIRITYKTNISPEYMVYFSKTNTYRRYIEDNMVSSAGQNTISRKGMASLLIPIPLMDEQTEIVRILDDLLAKEQQAKETAEAVLEQIDLMKKSILARAFRGELGTNDPAEESAVELVKENI